MSFFEEVEEAAQRDHEQREGGARRHARTSAPSATTAYRNYLMGVFPPGSFYSVDGLRQSLWFFVMQSKVLAGRVHIGQGLLKDGNRVGRIKSIRSGQESLKEARQGAEVAISVDGVTVGRQIEEGDILLVDIPESHARKLRKLEMTPVEEEVYEELLSIHRKNDHFWGR